MVEAMHGIWPDAPVYTSVYDPKATLPSFQLMDTRTSFLQNKSYSREADNDHIPVEAERFNLSARATGDYFFLLPQMAGYKRIDLAIDAFNHLGLRLLIVGDGSEQKRPQAAAGPNVDFLGF